MVKKKIVKINKKQEKEIEEEVEKEVERKLYKRLYSKTKGHAGKFSGEFKKHTLTAISAALGFLIALAWRAPIASAVESLIEWMGVVKEGLSAAFFSALVTTILAVFVLMIVSKWSSKKEDKK
jgi:uncharacterized membrane protein YdbT with pleckstrin-like domain